MDNFAVINAGEVTNIIVANANPNISSLGLLINISDLSPMPQIGWSYSNGTFTSPSGTPPIIITPEIAYNTFIYGGASVGANTSNVPTGVYSIDPTIQLSITIEAAFINAFNEFSDGTNSYFPWILNDGVTLVAFPTTASYMAFTKSVAQLVTSGKLALQMGLTGMPASILSIP